MGTINADTVLAEVRALVEEYRAQCLWFWRKDYYPLTPTDALLALDYIERYGDRAAFQRAAELRQWLLQNSKESSAA